MICKALEVDEITQKEEMRDAARTLMNLNISDSLRIVIETEKWPECLVLLRFSANLKL